MKKCPFCREEIQDDAIKCRYCLSSLLPPQPGSASTVPAAGPDQATYIIDNGLIRFGKFAGAILAIFVAVGVALWGVDIKKAADEAQAARDKAREAQDKAQDADNSIRKVADEVDAARKSVIVSEDSIRKVADEVDAARKSVIVSAERAQEAYRDIVTIKGKAQQAYRYMTLKSGGPGSGPPETISRPTPTAEASLTVPQLAQLYDFPTELDGKGQTIGIIELGGGYQDSDLDAYFAQLGIPKPQVTWISVDGAKNQPSNDLLGVDGQVTLDIEVAGAVAHAAHIVVYFAPNTSKGFLDAVTTAIADKINRPSVLTITWGSPESSWTSAARDELNNALKAAASQGITVIAAAGDNGVTDGINDGRAHVDFPASSPWVLASGGTRLITSDGKITSEVVWNGESGSATGGGVSDVFPRPDWQSNLNVPARRDGGTGRGIPDVAANAAPDTGYRVILHGHATVLGGTSATTPLWAGLIALINQGVGRNVGFINPPLYSKIGPAGVLRSITEGNNSVHGVKGYSAGPGWNACTGWGSPNGRKLLKAFQSL